MAPKKSQSQVKALGKVAGSMQSKEDDSLEVAPESEIFPLPLAAIKTLNSTMKTQGFRSSAPDFYKHDTHGEVQKITYTDSAGKSVYFYFE